MAYLKRWKIKRIVKKIKAMQANRVNNQPGDEMLKKKLLIILNWHPFTAS